MRPIDSLFPERAKLKAEGKCPICKEVVDMDGFTDELSKKEYGISGLCQTCQDRVFAM